LFGDRTRILPARPEKSFGTALLARKTRYSRGMLASSSQVRIRRGRLSDARALAEVFRESWQLAYTGIIPHLHLETMIRRRGAEWWTSSLKSGDRILVAEVAGRVGGYATWGAARAKSPFEGEIYELYLDPSYQGLGFGERLFEACRSGMDERRLRGLVVWALVDNTPAIDFYWRRGGRPVSRAFDRIGGARLEKIAFGWD
jgi:ribosomal protein S18 acetylase RimI-like enzyme